MYAFLETLNFCSDDHVVCTVCNNKKFSYLSKSYKMQRGLKLLKKKKRLNHFKTFFLESNQLPLRFG